MVNLKPKTLKPTDFQIGSLAGWKQNNHEREVGIVVGHTKHMIKVLVYTKWLNERRSPSTCFRIQVQDLKNPQDMEELLDLYNIKKKTNVKLNV